MADKRPIGYIPGKAYFMDKKTVKSPKYAHVGPTIDTGRNSSHIQVVSNKSVMAKKFEPFKRIKTSTVVNLMRKEAHTENIRNLLIDLSILIHLQKEAHTENIRNLLMDSESVSGYTLPEEQKSAVRSTISQSDYYEQMSHQGSVTSKVSVVTYGTEQLGLTNNTEFVVVDLRESDEYEQYHIKEAVHFPGPAIARDKYPTQIFSLKNKQDRLIIVYHNDERHGIPYATSFVEKGFENVFLISGGIEAVLEEAPELIEGKNVPAPPKKTKKSPVVLKRSLYMEYPDEGDVVIQSNYLVDETKSVVSHATGKTGKTSKSTKTLLSQARSQGASPRSPRY